MELKPEESSVMICWVMTVDPIAASAARHATKPMELKPEESSVMICWVMTVDPIEGDIFKVEEATKPMELKPEEGDIFKVEEATKPMELKPEEGDIFKVEEATKPMELKPEEGDIFKVEEATKPMELKPEEGDIFKVEEATKPMELKPEEGDIFKVEEATKPMELKPEEGDIFKVEEATKPMELKPEEGDIFKVEEATKPMELKPEEGDIFKVEEATKPMELKPEEGDIFKVEEATKPMELKPEEGDIFKVEEATKPMELKPEEGDIFKVEEATKPMELKPEEGDIFKVEEAPKPMELKPEEGDIFKLEEASKPEEEKKPEEGDIFQFEEASKPEEKKKPEEGDIFQFEEASKPEEKKKPEESEASQQEEASIPEEQKPEVAPEIVQIFAGAASPSDGWNDDFGFSDEEKHTKPEAPKPEEKKPEENEFFEAEEENNSFSPEEASKPEEEQKPEENDSFSPEEASKPEEEQKPEENDSFSPEEASKPEEEQKPEENDSFSPEEASKPEEEQKPEELPKPEEKKQEDTEGTNMKLLDMESRLAQSEAAKNQIQQEEQMKNNALQAKLSEMESKLAQVQQEEQMKNNALQAKLSEMESKLAQVLQEEQMKNNALQAKLSEMESKLAQVLQEGRPQENNELQTKLSEMESKLSQLEAAKNQALQEEQMKNKELQARLFEMESRFAAGAMGTQDAPAFAPTPAPIEEGAATGVGKAGAIRDLMAHLIKSQHDVATCSKAGQMTKPEPLPVFKGKTFWEILHDHPDYFAWTQKNAKSPGASEYAEWVNQNFESPSGYSSSSADHIEGAVNNCLRGLGRSRCLVVTSGARWTGRQPSFPGAKVLQIDCRHFHDPDSDRSIRGCTGRHPSIIRGVALHEAMNDLVEQVTDFLRANPNGKLVIHLYCTSGRHRSVGLAALIYYFLDVTDWRKPLLIHYHSPEWREMTCGGHCSLCATADTRELGNLMNRHLPDVRVVDVDEPDRAYYNGDEIYPHVDTIQDCASSSPCMFQHIHLQAVVLETHLVEEHITKETNEAVIMEDKTDQKKILFERQAWSAISKQPPIRRPCDESQRQRLEREPRDILNDNSGDPYCWNVDEDILSWIISSAKLWGNRDRVIWITDPSLPHEEQQQQGIRVDIKLRSHVRSTLISGGKWMNRQGWVKSSFYRPRDSAGTLWNRLQREEAVGENVDLPTTWADLVIFSHRDVRPRAYTGRVVLLSGDQGFEGSIAPKTEPQNAPKTEPQNAPKTEPQKSQKYVPKTKVHLQSRKNPPTPPQPSRFMICTDDDMFKGNPKIQTPKDESTDYSTSSSDESPVAKPVKSKSSNGKPCHEKTPKDEVIIKTEPGDVLPVGLMARDPDGPNMHEVVLDSIPKVTDMSHPYSRSHFERARNAAAQWSVEQVEQSTAMFTCFMAGKDEIVEEGKKVTSRHRDLEIMQGQLKMAAMKSMKRAGSRRGAEDMNRTSGRSGKAQSMEDEAAKEATQRRKSIRQSVRSEISQAVTRSKGNKKTLFAHAHDESNQLREYARNLHNQKASQIELSGGSVGETNPIRSRLRSIVSSIAFEAIAGCIIITNAVIIGLEVEHMAVNRAYRSPDWFQTLHLLYAIVFAVEFALRLTAYGWDLYNDSDLFRWACLDCFIVVSSFIDLALAFEMRAKEQELSGSSSSGMSAIRVMRVLRISRLIRVTRIAKLMMWLKALRTLIHSIFVTLKSLVWALVLLALIMYVFAIMLSSAAIDRLVDLQDLPRDAWSASDLALEGFWGSMGDAVSTLFMSITGGISWQIAETPLMGLSLAWKVVFMLYISFTMFAVLNVMTGVFCQSAIESAARDHDMAMQNVMSDKEAFTRKFLHLFHMLDQDDTGLITLVELEERMEDVDVKTYFEALELSIDDVWTFFRLLDGDDGQEIDVEEFIYGCMRLRGEAKALDLAKLMHSHAWLAKQQVDFMMFCEEKFVQLQYYLAEGRSSTSGGRL
ncbi:unnamed protein product [Cladocopium goreaui]|uniref:Sodium channel protein type 4 subunit alpha B n=1 Tax=Cladocopium goreaui TaxID=2562237 RepID=A0A9P1DIE0_9DINO|nr:unnamed protein product [Cladocopium goreaui]